MFMFLHLERTAKRRWSQIAESLNEPRTALRGAKARIMGHPRDIMSVTNTYIFAL